MSPTLVLKDGQPVIALGAAGGPKIISQVVLELVCLLDLGMSPEEAVAQPRIHHQWFPNELMVEKTLPRALQVGLAKARPQAEADASDGRIANRGAEPRRQGFRGRRRPPRGRQRRRVVSRRLRQTRI